MIEDSAHDKGVLWIESEGRVEKTGKTAQQEASGNEEHKSESDLCYRNTILQTLTAAAGANLFGAQGRLRRNSRETPCRRKSKEEAGNKRKRKGKQQDQWVDRYILKARQAGWTEVLKPCNQHEGK